MNNNSRPNRSWMSILIRLVLVSSFLMMMASTALSLANSSAGAYQMPAAITSSGQGKTHQHHAIQRGPVVPERQAATQPQHAVQGTPGSRLSASPAAALSAAPSAALSAAPSAALSAAPSAALSALGPNAIQGPVDLKLLVISADGKETDFAAITAFLNQIGVPYDTLIASQTPLVSTTLWDGVSHGYYQGILLCTGNLAYESAPNVWISAFDDTEWATLWQYEQLFGVRQVTLYTFPYGYPDNYGLNYLSASGATLQTQLTPAGQQVFPYLNATTPITVANSWTYLATVISPTATTPLLVTPDGYAIASVTKYPDGRENLTVTTANNPYLMHSMLLSYGIINWVTNGLFLGERHVNLTAQIDDLLAADDIWDTGALTDTTGLFYRMSDTDLNAVMAWQANRQASTPNASTLRLEWAFNGAGASGDPNNDGFSPDALTPAVIANQSQFNWVNHTYSHPNLDAITYNEATTELSRNHTVATSQLSLTHYFKDAMVQPDVSGLGNSEFLRAAKDFGLRNLIADTSRPGWNNPGPNAGFYSTYQPSLLIIPRRPANLFYNVSTPAEWASEYNHFYAPGGLWPTWDHNLSYAEVLDKESEIWLSYLLKWDLDPLMFHQPNTRAYNGNQTLLGDLIDATLAKYNRYFSNLPVRNLSEHEVGINMANRMAYNTSGVRATILPCSVITLTATSPALIPVTGIAYGSNTEVYGGQNISYIQLNANQTLVLPATCTPANKADQTITFGPLANKTYGDPPFAIAATASSNLMVTFAAAGSCSVGASQLNGTSSTATVTLTGAGSCTITATQSGDANFNAAPPVSQTLTIAKANQTITFGPLAAKTYGNPPFAIAATASSNLTVTFAAAGPCSVGASQLNGTSSSATVTLTGAGSCTITASQPGDANFNAAPPVSQTFSIAKANQTITFASLANRTYGPPFAITATASSGLMVTFAAAGPCSVGASQLNGTSSSATVTLTGLGSCTITASQPGNANFNAAPSVSRTFSIAKANQTITFASLANRTYGPPFAITATASSGLMVTFAAAGPCSVGASQLNGTSSSATVTLTGLGSCTITASQPGNANVNAAPSVSRTFSIAKANQTITFASLANRTYGPPFAISATASSGLIVTFAAAGPCSVGASQLNGTSSSATVTLTGLGSCTITASQPGNANVNAAPSVSRTFSIAKANQTITFASLANKRYGNPPYTITATASSGLIVTFAAAGPCSVSASQLNGTSSTATVTLTGVGSCTITASQPGNANFNAAPSRSRTVTINKANQTITFVSPGAKTYGNPPFAISASASSGLMVTFAAAGPCSVGASQLNGTSSTATVTLTGVGYCTITASQPGNVNFNAATSRSRTFRIR